jgi:predicted TIM-barrel fold metal-dependent hydrolase
MAPVVDAHLHVWRALSDEAPRSGLATIVGPHEDVPVERAMGVMNEHGVDRAVLVQPVFRGEDNSYVAEAAACDPDRFAAVCVVDPREPGADDRLEEWVSGHGCRGLRLRPKLTGESEVFGLPSTFPLWDRARSLKVVVSVLADPAHLRTLDALAGRFPEVAIVVDHLAHPDVSAGAEGGGFRDMLGLARHARLSIKISGYYHFTEEPDPYTKCWPLIRAVFDAFGPDRLIWGSDFPHVERRGGYARALELVRSGLPFLTDDDRNLILGGNADRLYWPSP